jgi:ankyrin repeat protein
LKIKCLSLHKTKKILDTFCFLLQACQYLVQAAKSGDVNTTKRWAYCNSNSCTAGDYWRNTPLILATWLGHVEVVRVLLESGADVHAADLNMHTALHTAAKHGRLELCGLLLDWGAAVNTEGVSKLTALHLAAEDGHLSVVKFLVERGADVRLKDDKGQTAAELARSKGNTAVADWLDSVSRV